MDARMLAVRESVTREFGSWEAFRRHYGPGWVVQLAWMLSWSV